MQELSDAQLMELVKNGDFAAFDELYARYCKPVRRFLFSLTWDQDTAEDCLQEVFLRLYRARDRYRPTGKFSTYLFQIAKNYYLSQRRRLVNRRAERRLEDNPGARESITSIRASDRADPYMRLLESYRRLQIRRAIQSLPESQKLVFVMAHLEDMRYEEIAEVLEIPVGTVKSRMYTAVRSLRSLLQEEQK